MKKLTSWLKKSWNSRGNRSGRNLRNFVRVQILALVKKQSYETTNAMLFCMIWYAGLKISVAFSTLKMLWYVKKCYDTVVPCYATLVCYVGMLWYVIEMIRWKNKRYATVRNAMLQAEMLCYNQKCYATVRNAMLQPEMLCHSQKCYAIL